MAICSRRTSRASPLTGIITAQSLAFGPEGALYCGRLPPKIRCWSSIPSEEPHERASAGLGAQRPQDMVLGPHGDLFVASSMSQEVLRFSRDGLPLDSIGSDTGLQDPRGLAFAPDGHLWVSSYGTDEVLEFDPSGVLVGVHGVGSLDGPEGLAFSPHTGRLYVADYLNDRLVVIGAAGAVLDLIEPESLRGPTSLSFGPDNNLYVASSGSGEILVMNEDGVVDRTMAGGDLGSPSDIAFSPFVFETSVKGRTFPSGAPGAPFKRLARLNWAPGSGRASLLLLDKDGGSDKDPLFGHDRTRRPGFRIGPHQTWLQEALPWQRARCLSSTRRSRHTGLRFAWRCRESDRHRKPDRHLQPQLLLRLFAQGRDRSA